VQAGVKGAAMDGGDWNPKSSKRAAPAKAVAHIIIQITKN